MKTVNTGYIDIHTHILPGIDDGARDEKETAFLLKCAAREDTRVMIATPHFIPKLQETAPERVLQAVGEANQLSLDLAAGITIYPGNELYIIKGACESVVRGSCLTLAGGSHVLCEFPMNEFPGDENIQEIDGLLKAGYIPIIAHPERYAWFDRGISLFRALIKMGCSLQVNSDSISSEAGKFAKKNAELLMAASMIQFISSDCHDSRARISAMEEAHKLVCRKCGMEAADRLFYGNACCILK